MIKENINIYVTTLIRYKQYGYIYDVDFPNCIRNRAQVRNRTQVAQHGGPHGLGRSNDLLVTGTYDDIRIYDKHLNLVGKFTHNFLSGVHGLNVKEGKVWVSSCNNEAVLCFSLDGDLDEVHFLEENPKLMGLIGKKPVSVSRTTDYREQQRPYESQPFHVNDVQRTTDGLEVSLHKLGIVYDLYEDKVVAQIESDDIHDGRSHSNGVYINNTGKQKVVKVTSEDRPNRECKVDIMEIGSASTKLNVIKQKAKHKIIEKIKSIIPFSSLPSRRCNANWLRGLCVVDEEHVVVGTSPASVCLVNIEKREVVDYLQLSDQLCEAVFAIMMNRNVTSE